MKLNERKFGFFVVLGFVGALWAPMAVAQTTTGGILSAVEKGAMYAVDACFYFYSNPSASPSPAVRTATDGYDQCRTGANYVAAIATPQIVEDGHRSETTVAQAGYKFCESSYTSDMSKASCVHGVDAFVVNYDGFRPKVAQGDISDETQSKNTAVNSSEPVSTQAGSSSRLSGKRAL